MSTNQNLTNKTPRGALKVLDFNIPDNLKLVDKWLLWRYEFKNNKTSKVPKLTNGFSARINDRSNLTTFEDALKAYKNGDFDGLGFVLGDGFHGIDLDDCRDPITSELNELAFDVLKKVDGYAEVSPSGTGIKIIATTNLETSKANASQGIELYNGQRYFCITGHVLPDHLDISQDIQDVSWLLKRINSSSTTTNNQDIFASYKSPIPDWSLERVKSDLLPFLDSDEYSDWISVGFAMHHQGSGDDQWLNAWDEWSQSSEKYLPNECLWKWNSFNNSKKHGINPLTIATLISKTNFLNKETNLKPKLINHEPLKIYSVDELSQLPSQSWLVKGVIPRTGLGVIYGESGAGKTFITLDLALSISRGIHWNNNKVNTSIGVLYVSAEGGSAISKRLNAYSKFHKIDSSQLSLGVVTVGINLRDGDCYKVIDACKKREEIGQPFGMIILDTLNRTMGGGDENASKDMGEYISAVGKISDETNSFVLIVHHTGKDTKRGARGHSSLRAAVDTELELKSEDDQKILTVTKSRDGETGAEFFYRLKTIDLGYDLDLEPITSCVVIPGNSIELSSRKPKPNGKWQGIALQALRALINDGYQPTATQVLIKMGEIANHTDRWRDMAKRGIEGIIKTGVVIARGDQLLMT